MTGKYVFIDRDGVINKDCFGVTEYGYVTRWEDFQFLPRVPEAFKRFTDAGYKTVIISNQQCVGKGYLTEEELNKITQKMICQIEENGGKVHDVNYCLHLKEEECGCRKPDPGLFRIAKEKLGIEKIEGSFYVGDTQRDIQAGKAAGLHTILVLSGKGSREDAETWEYKPDYICADLYEAAELVISVSD